MEQAPLVSQEPKNHKVLENTGPPQKDGLKYTFLCCQKSFSRVVWNLRRIRSEAYGRYLNNLSRWFSMTWAYCMNLIVPLLPWPHRLLCFSLLSLRGYGRRRCYGSLCISRGWGHKRSPICRTWAETRCYKKLPHWVFFSLPPRLNLDIHTQDCWAGITGRKSLLRVWREKIIPA